MLLVYLWCFLQIDVKHRFNQAPCGNLIENNKLYLLDPL